MAGRSGEHDRYRNGRPHQTQRSQRDQRHLSPTPLAAFAHLQSPAPCKRLQYSPLDRAPPAEPANLGHNEHARTQRRAFRRFLFLIPDSIESVPQHRACTSSPGCDAGSRPPPQTRLTEFKTLIAHPAFRLQHVNAHDAERPNADDSRSAVLSELRTFPNRKRPDPFTILSPLVASTNCIGMGLHPVSDRAISWRVAPA
jgi:hypothetical protein